MLRPITEIKALYEQYKVPVVVAGDIFHKPDPETWLINWACENLFNFYGIPGNHELPDHRYADKARSAYQTLVYGQICTDMAPEKETELPMFGAWAFPFGYEPTPCTAAWHEFYFHVCVAHKFVWIDGHGHVGAPDEARIKRRLPQLKGYTAAVFGDNHKGFLVQSPMTIFNCGGLMRRRKDEKEYKPQVGIMHSNGTITPHYLDCSGDKFFDSTKLKALPQEQEGSPELAKLVAELGALGDVSCDFKALCRRRAEAEGVRAGVRSRVLTALGE